MSRGTLAGTTFSGLGPPATPPDRWPERAGSPGEPLTSSAWPQRAIERAVAGLASGGEATAVPLLGGRQRRHLVRDAARVSAGAAAAVAGGAGHEVNQGFHLGAYVPASLLATARGINGYINRALAALPCPALRPFVFNEFRLQYYPATACGISPHRDHRRYRHVVAVLVLAGQGRFFICFDRDGRGSRQVVAPAGWLSLMRGAGFGGSSERPFHAVVDVFRPRWMLGMRCLAP